MEKIQGSGDGENANDTPQHPDMAPWRRIIVALAGPAGNVVLAVFVAWVIYAFAPKNATGALDAQVGYVIENSEAWEAGLRPEQIITKVGKRNVKKWYDFKVEAHIQSGKAAKPVAVTVLDNGEERTFELPVKAQKMGARTFRSVPGVNPFDPCDITHVVPGSPAEKAGVKVNDRTISINGKKIMNDMMFIRTVRENGEQPLALVVLRDGAEFEFEITPRPDPELGRPTIGVKLGSMQFMFPWMAYRDPGRQVWWDAGSVHRALDGLAAPKAKGERGAVATEIGGPVTLLSMLWMAVQSGLWACLGLVRMICINLAILNLLPFPVLDGGHICFGLWEIITRRKPHPKFVSISVNVFAVLLIGLMLLLTFKDSWGLGRDALEKRRQTRQQEQAGQLDEPVLEETLDDTEPVEP